MVVNIEKGKTSMPKKRDKLIKQVREELSEAKSEGKRGFPKRAKLCLTYARDLIDTWLKKGK